MQNDIIDMSTAQLLKEVNNAISTILIGGQSYTIGRRTLTRADLGALRSLRSDLMAQLSAEDTDGSLIANAYVAIFDGR